MHLLATTTNSHPQATAVIALMWIMLGAVVLTAALAGYVTRAHSRAVDARIEAMEGEELQLGELLPGEHPPQTPMSELHRPYRTLGAVLGEADRRTEDEHTASRAAEVPLAEVIELFGGTDPTTAAEIADTLTARARRARFGFDDDAA